MNETIQLLHSRKSMRVYEDRAIEPERKQAILEAAVQAPTAGNMTLYTIMDITDQAIKDRLAVTCDNQPFIATAPMVLVFCADYKRWYDLFCRWQRKRHFQLRRWQSDIRRQSSIRWKHIHSYHTFRGTLRWWYSLQCYNWQNSWRLRHISICIQYRW